MPVAIIINDRDLVRAGDSTDILDKLALKSKRIHEKQAVEPVYINTFSKKLTCGKDNLKVAGLDLFHFGLLAALRVISTQCDCFKPILHVQIQYLDMRFPFGEQQYHLFLIDHLVQIIQN